MGATAAVIGLGLSALSLWEQNKAQKKQAEAAEDANEAARQEAEEQKKELAAEKAEKLKERKTLVDNMRVQLGAGLNMGNVMGTRFKKTAGATTPTSTLG